jgi:hypothetical protein
MNELLIQNNPEYENVGGILVPRGSWNFRRNEWPLQIVIPANAFCYRNHGGKAKSDYILNRKGGNGELNGVIQYETEDGSSKVHELKIHILGHAFDRNPEISQIENTPRLNNTIHDDEWSDGKMTINFDKDSLDGLLRLCYLDRANLIYDR